MRRAVGQAGVVVKTVEAHGDELLWLAEVMTGSRQAGEQCLAEAIELAEEAQYLGPEWILSWVNRLLVQVALRHVSAEIRELLRPAGAQQSVAPARAGMKARDRQTLRSIPPQSLVFSFNVLERACLILHAYLDYAVLDCALLIGCPRAWIQSICERVAAKAMILFQVPQNASRNVNAFLSSEVAECAG